MELRHLRYFVAVAETMNVTKAARNLNLAQPALTQQIKALEAEIGVALFRRVGRGIELTAAGTRFREDARALLERGKAAILTAQQVARGDIGRLAIGLTESAGFSPRVTKAIRRFMTAYPDVDLTLVEGRTEELIQALADRRIDVALVRPPVPSDRGWRVSTIEQEKLIAAISIDHGLARLTVLRLSDLHGTTLVWPRRRASGGGVAQALQAALADAGVVPRGMLETNEFATAVNMAATGLGIALVPTSLSSLRPDAVVFRPLEIDTPILAELVLVAPSDGPSPAAANFQTFFASTPGVEGS